MTLPHICQLFHRLAAEIPSVLLCSAAHSWEESHQGPKCKTPKTVSSSFIPHHLTPAPFLVVGPVSRSPMPHD